MNAWQNTTNKTFTLIGAQSSVIADIPPGFALAMVDDWPQVIECDKVATGEVISIHGAEWNYGATDSPNQLQAT